jgi:hypothetical protein
MLHFSGSRGQQELIDALTGFLPLYGSKSRQHYEVEYMDDDKHQVMIANFVWLNSQWVFIDAREK